MSDQWGVGPMRCRKKGVKSHHVYCSQQVNLEIWKAKHIQKTNIYFILNIMTYIYAFFIYFFLLFDFPAYLGVNMHFYAKCTSMFIIKAKYLCSTASFIKVITSHISWGLLLYYNEVHQSWTVRWINANFVAQLRNELRSSCRNWEIKLNSIWCTWETNSSHII